tara:strand:- start:471 stop:890 length:420 start_codon:yes stop_codon:yes gene_type:complete
MPTPDEHADTTVEETPAPVEEEATVEELETVETLEEALETGKELQEEIQEGDWTAAIALGLMLAIFIIRKYVWSSISKKAIPWFTIGIAVAGELAVALYSGMDPLWAILSGLTLGLASIGGYEALKSLGILKKPNPEAK